MSETRQGSVKWGRAWQYKVEEVPGKGWIAYAYRATAQGATQGEAIKNLNELVRAYPELEGPTPKETHG